MNDQSVGAVIRSVLPNGSLDGLPPAQNGSRENWTSCPLFPTDVFAAAGYLLKLGGAIAFFEPSPYVSKDKLGRGHFVLSQSERKAADEAGVLWRDAEKNPSGHPPSVVQSLWKKLISDWDQSVTPGSYLEDDTSAEPWWKTALTLTVIADMACNRILRDEVGEFVKSPFESWIQDWYLTPFRVSSNGEVDGSSEEDIEGPQPPASLTLLADRAVVCVLPKVRVSPVGATLRNLSRNLSLLPGRGEVRCSWFDLPQEQPEEDSETQDILLIPEPSEIDANSFRPALDNEDEPGQLHYWKRDWDYFDIEQTWISSLEKRQSFIGHCRALMSSAKKQTRRVNGVVLPEYALDYALFEDLCQALKRLEPELEFVISGSSDNCREAEGKTPEPGNHVLTKVWYGDEKEGLYRTVSRRKHHRWRMDRSQVETYALSTALNPKIKYWWENCPLGRRAVHFHRFRKRSVFSVLICEELARSDPCHEILRSVAPNLIFALLLDGPQIKSRWPAQYASNLADDPGSSVLTMTSYGLINRSNELGKYDPCRAFAMWKDKTGKIVEIDMPKGKGPRGILLSLWSEHVSDRTIAGKNNLARSWRYSSHFPIYPSAEEALANANKSSAN
ncbi:hypothetical protein [Flavimaricola marinus]|uniref:Uncharacterized protein n=1 Tax=Flavimaricola marinus TaxID=1819565 RepID=A0A238LKS5_9RHOB|nr:hypothetical protein [Flavimaricola marinus]SMY10271.1 hypothetical protein LOM8899_04446 [Flavimaricola marinus]